MRIKLKTHFALRKCHVAFRFKNANNLILDNSFVNVDCKLCLAKNSKRRQDKIIRIVQDNLMGIMKYSEMGIHAFDNTECFLCNEKFEIDDLYVFQTRFQCKTCVLSHFVNPSNFKKMKVKCLRDGTEFEVIKSSGKNYSLLYKGWITCPRCHRGYDFNSYEIKGSQWYCGHPLEILEAELQEDVKLPKNLETRELAVYLPAIEEVVQ